MLSGMCIASSMAMASTEIERYYVILEVRGPDVTDLLCSLSMAYRRQASCLRSGTVSSVSVRSAGGLQNHFPHAPLQWDPQVKMQMFCSFVHCT